MLKKDVDARDICEDALRALARARRLSENLPRSFNIPLPIDAVLDELARTLAGNNAAVLVAPPGAGKTTRVPLALLDAPWAGTRKIIVLEPRRIAARASAERMAKTLGERVGETVGYRVRRLKVSARRGSKSSPKASSHGEFSTIRNCRASPRCCSMNFTSARSMPLGLALARDAQVGLREDLRILVMSATLDGARVAKWSAMRR